MTDMKHVLSSIQNEERTLFSLFCNSLKKRIGQKKLITIPEIIKGFKSKGHSMTSDTVKRFGYQASVKGHVPKLIYSHGDGYFISTNNKEVHSYINQLWAMAEEATNRDLSLILLNQARALNEQV